MPTIPDLTPEEIAALPHDDKGGTVLAVHWVLSGLATLFLALRVFCKIYGRKRLWWDDWILVASWFTIVATDGLTTVLVNEFKLGRHSYDLEIYDPVKFTLVLSSRATTTITSLVLTKTAFAVTLLRLTTEKTKALVWVIIISMNLTMGFSAAIPWIQCQPLAKGWDSSIPGTCWARQVGTKIWVATGAQSAAMDFLLAALPWTFLYRTLLKKKEKIGILIAMSMGVVAGSVAIVKCVKLPYLGSGDMYDEVEVFIWDIAESTVTMMAACIPTLRVLLRDVGSSASSGERTTRLSQFSVSFVSNRGRRIFDDELEIVHEVRMSKEDSSSRKSGGDSGGRAGQHGRE